MFITCFVLRKIEKARHFSFRAAYVSWSILKLSFIPKLWNWWYDDDDESILHGYLKLSI